MNAAHLLLYNALDLGNLKRRKLEFEVDDDGNPDGNYLGLLL